MKKLKCHCGEIEAEINIKDNLEKILRWNCSLCKRKGAVMSLVKNVLLSAKLCLVIYFLSFWLFSEFMFVNRLLSILNLKIE